MFFFFNDTATTEIYTLSLHDALPILALRRQPAPSPPAHRDDAAVRGSAAMTESVCAFRPGQYPEDWVPDRKSTRLNSSYANISYAVFCLKKKNNLLVISRG